MKRLYNNKIAKQLKLSGSASIPYLDLPNGKKLYTLTTAITSGVTTDSTGAVAGDLAVTTNATGRTQMFYSNGTLWVALGDGGAGFTAGVAVADPAALTSAVLTGGESPTEAEHNALRADVVAIRTQLVALITSLEGGGIIA